MYRLQNSYVYYKASDLGFGAIILTLWCSLFGARTQQAKNTQQQLLTPMGSELKRKVKN